MGSGNPDRNPDLNSHPNPITLTLTRLVSLALERGVGAAAATCAVFAICLKVDILQGVLTSIALRVLYLVYLYGRAIRMG